MEPQQIKQADVSKLYLENLILHLDALTILYRELLRDYTQVKMDEINYNKCLTEMVVVMIHLLPKLEGGGAGTEPLYKDFAEYETWSENILIAKLDIEERKKIHKLFKLIIKAYDVLGISRY